MNLNLIVRVESIGAGNLVSVLFMSVFMACIGSCEHARDFPAAGQVNSRAAAPTAHAFRLHLMDIQ